MKNEIQKFLILFLIGCFINLSCCADCAAGKYKKDGVGGCTY